MSAGVLTAYVEQRPVRRPPVLTAAARNVRPRLAVVPDQLPDPIRYGDTPARAARQQIATFLSIASIKAVMRDEFYVKTIAPQHLADRPPGIGSLAPWNVRPNIHRPEPGAYGTNAGTLSPADPFAKLYPKITYGGGS